MSQMTRIWKAFAAALLGGAMVLGLGASPASAQLDELTDALLEGCAEFADSTDEQFQQLCDGIEDGLDELIDACDQITGEISEELQQLCDILGAAEEDLEPEPEETTTTTAPPPPPTEPPAPPATEAPAPAPTTAAALPSTGGTGAGVALLAGGVLAAGALALRRFAAA
jgi:LPXTG-motif cell wall-anchored protein